MADFMRCLNPTGLTMQSHNSRLFHWVTPYVGPSRATEMKEADVAKRPQASHHVGLLFIERPAIAGLPFN